MHSVATKLHSDSGLSRAISAGTHPAEHVHPVVLEAMREVGIDLSNAKPQKLMAELAQEAELLITMGCGDECPYIPGLRRDDWPLPDLKGQGIETVCQPRDEIQQRVLYLLAGEQKLAEIIDDSSTMNARAEDRVASLFRVGMVFRTPKCGIL